MWLEYFKIARKVLVAHKFRSLLTVLSITIGAFSIVLMSSLAQSGMATLSADIEELGGGRLLYIWPKPSEREEAKRVSYSRGLTKDDRDALLERLPHVVDRTMFTTLNGRDVLLDDGKLIQTDIVGGDGDFFSALHMQAVRGRFFTDEENRRHAKVCVVGAHFADEAWGGDAVGHTIAIGGLRCKVIGQLSAKEYFGMNYPFDWLRLVVTPLETVGEVDPDEAKARLTLQMKLDDIQSQGIVKRISNALLLERHNGQDDFQLFDFSGVMKKFESLLALMGVVVGFIAGIALLVGGMGVMNMMLVSVSERVREIGIRKALGASPKDIRSQFLLESIVLSGTGGLIGVVTGLGLSQLAALVVRHFKPSWLNVVSHGAVFAALGVSVGIGVLFGYFPARRAARMDAILAIRR
ncbi:MAG: Macrolide-specific ABC-type efflux carrier [Myxococcales bacterium]|nr:Macrolide-specific ABC-type efflux carrier [Myxococcales bacterium]